MNKLLKYLMVSLVLLMAFVINNTSVKADTVHTNGDFTYTINGNEATLIRYDGSSQIVIIPETVNMATVKYVGYKAFYNHDEIEEVRMPDTIQRIMDGEYDKEYDQYVGAFENCSNLKKVVLSKNITEIGKWAFALCTSLSEIALPDKLITIGEGSLEGCTSLKTLTIPNSVKSIGQCGLYQAGLLELDIPSGIEDIGVDAISIDSLEIINVASDNRHYASYKGALYSKDYHDLIQYPLGNKAQNYTVHNDTVNIWDAFSGSKYLKKLYLLGNVKIISTVAFQSSSIEEFSITKNNTNFITIDGVLFSKDGKRLIIYPTGKKDKIYFVPSGVTAIGYGHTFDKCSYLEELYVPSSVTEFDGTMWYSPSLKKVVFAEGCKINYLGTSMFQGCESLESFVIPESVASFEYGNNFLHCSNLKSIYIGPSSKLYDLQESTFQLFNGCYNLTIYGYGSNHAVSKLANEYLVKYVDISNSCEKVLGITFKDTTVNLLKDTQYNLGTVVYPATVQNNQVEYTVSNPKVAVVSDEGTVTAINEGTCVITAAAKDGSKEYARCQIKVFDKFPSFIAISGKTALYSGKPLILDTPVVTGSNGPITYTYYSDSKCTKKLDSTPTDVGKYYIIATVAEAGDYMEANSDPVCVEIVKKSIASFKVSCSGKTNIYDGKQHQPEITVKNGSRKLVNGTDYTVKYSNNTNAGTATAVITGIGNYQGELKTTFVIKPKAIKNATVLSIGVQKYTGKAIHPSFILKVGKVLLANNKDYIISYKDNIQVGTATITIIGKGNYSGTKTIKFKIVKK
ncbi:MAG: leucine-rich repeat protein [Mobilitalea sp.]